MGERFTIEKDEWNESGETDLYRRKNTPEPEFLNR
jgi:hypothetical protein